MVTLDPKLHTAARRLSELFPISHGEASGFDSPPTPYDQGRARALAKEIARDVHYELSRLPSEKYSAQLNLFRTAAPDSDEFREWFWKQEKSLDRRAGLSRSLSFLEPLVWFRLKGKRRSPVLEAIRSSELEEHLKAAEPTKKLALTGFLDKMGARYFFEQHLEAIARAKGQFLETKKLSEVKPASSDPGPETAAHWHLRNKLRFHGDIILKNVVGNSKEWQKLSLEERKKRFEEYKSKINKALSSVSGN